MNNDVELVKYILIGLGEYFSSLVAALTTMVEPINVREIYSQLLNFESRMDLCGGSGSRYINAASGGSGGACGGGRDQQGGQLGCGLSSSPSHGRRNSAA